MKALETRSIRFRLTVWYAVILIAGLGLFGGLVWFSLRQRLIGEVDRDLEGRAARFEKYFRAESAESSAGLRDELWEFCQALPPSSYIHLRGDSGFDFRHPDNEPPASSDSRILRRQFTANGETFDLELSAPIGDVIHTLELLRLLLVSFIPVVIAIACAGGAWLSGRALKPVRDVTAAALTISIENLSERLPVPKTGDELARLTEVLNRMLARLESAVKTLSQFVADASHELRTPVAVIRTTAELALRRTRTAECYRESLQEVAAEADRITQLVGDLLTMARSEAGLAEMPLEPLDVREILSDVLSETRRLAEVSGIRVNSLLGDSPPLISANRPALHRMFLALMDNALKYSGPGSEVNVTLRSDGPRICIGVQDSGSGISRADLPHIFERFYRAGARTGGGHGLGLSLAERIARAHGGTIEARSVEGGGSTFQVTLPTRAARVEVAASAAASS